MEGKKILRYSIQLSMLKQLLNLKLINELEYEQIQKKANAGLWDSVQHYSLTYELYCIIIKANTTIGTQKRRKIWK